MTPRSLAILACIALLVGGGAWLTTRSQDQKTTQSAMPLDRPVFPAFAMADVRAISILPVGSPQVDVVYATDRWVVASQDDYPADGAKVVAFIRALAGLRPRLLLTNDGDLAPYHLTEPGTETAGIRITLRGEGDAILSDLIIGMPYSPGGSAGGGSGNYMVLAGETQVFAALSPIGNEDLSSDAWIDRTFVKIDDAAALALTRDGKLEWAIRRGKPSADWSPDFQLPDDKGLDTRRATETADALRWTNYASVLAADAKIDPTDADFSAPQVLRVETFSGPVYTLTVGAKRAQDGQFPLRIAVEWPGDAARNPTVQARYEREQRVLPNWVYIVPAYTVERLICDRERLLKSVYRLAPSTATQGGGVTEEPVEPGTDEPAPTLDDLTQPVIQQPIAGDDDDDGGM